MMQKTRSLLTTVVAMCLVLSAFTLTAGAAQYESQLVVYTAHGPELVDPVMDVFKQKYPDFKVTVIQAGTGVMLSRIRAEKANPGGDVMWGGAVEFYQAEEDLFAPYVSPEDVRFQVADPKNIWHANSVLPQAIAVNTRLVKPEQYPATFQALLDPKWKAAGGIAFAHPGRSGTGYTILTSMVTLYGWDYVEKFLANAKITNSSDEMFKMVRDGEVPVGFINEDLGVKWIEGGAPLKLIYPQDGVSNQVDACGLIQGAKHPNAAKLFIDFILSKEIQQVYTTVLVRRSARTDVAPPQGLVPLSDYKLVVRDGKWISTQKDEILQEFEKRLSAARSR